MSSYIVRQISSAPKLQYISYSAPRAVLVYCLYQFSLQIHLDSIEVSQVCIFLVL